MQISWQPWNKIICIPCFWNSIFPTYFLGSESESKAEEGSETGGETRESSVAPESSVDKQDEESKDSSESKESGSKASDDEEDEDGELGRRGPWHFFGGGEEGDFVFFVM